MLTSQRLKLEMFGRVKNFGVAHRDVFPEESAGGKLFARLAAQVVSIEDELVRHAQARADARRLNRDTRETARQAMKALAATGRRASKGETTPHAFRLSRRKAATVTLNTARLLKEEAERRKDRFAELGMPPTFLDDYSKVVDELARAVTVQQDSRGATRRAGEALANAFAAGTAIVADLDVTVPNALGADRVAIAEWQGARHISRAHGSSGRPNTAAQPPVEGAAPSTASAPAASDSAPAPAGPDLKLAS